jgi:Gas vesicle protein G
MFLIDDLLMFPVTGIKFVLRTLNQVAEQEYTDSSPLKMQLLELQEKLDSGEISEEEYVKAEADILRELREIERRKRELAGVPPETRVTGVEVEMSQQASPGRVATQQK